VTWNPHKLLCAPQQCSVFLLKDGTIATETHATRATYLFQQDKFYEAAFDTGDKYIQCGRRADVLKFWLMWKAKVNKCCELIWRSSKSKSKLVVNYCCIVVGIRERLDLLLILIIYGE